jgi:hypothetical protein
MACEGPTLNLGYSVLPGTENIADDAGDERPDDAPPDSSREEERVVEEPMPVPDAEPRDAGVTESEASIPLTADTDAAALDAALPRDAGDAGSPEAGPRDAGDAGDAGDAATGRDAGDADAGDASRPPDGTCETDSDCPLSALSHCHPSYGRCVNCVTSRDCGGNECEPISWHCENHQ